MSRGGDVLKVGGIFVGAAVEVEICADISIVGVWVEVGRAGFCCSHAEIITNPNMKITD